MFRCGNDSHLPKDFNRSRRSPQPARPQGCNAILWGNSDCQRYVHYKSAYFSLKLFSGNNTEIIPEDRPFKLILRSFLLPETRFTQGRSQQWKCEQDFGERSLKFIKMNCSKNEFEKSRLTKLIS